MIDASYPILERPTSRLTSSIGPLASTILYRLTSILYPLPSGVTVAHGSLEPLVGVRIPARQPRIWRRHNVAKSRPRDWLAYKGLFSLA